MRCKEYDVPYVCTVVYNVRTTFNFRHKDFSSLNVYTIFIWYLLFLTKIDNDERDYAR